MYKAIISHGGKEFSYPDLLNQLRDTRNFYEANLGKNQKKTYQTTLRKVSYSIEELSLTYSDLKEIKQSSEKLEKASVRTFQILASLLVVTHILFYILLDINLIIHSWHVIFISAILYFVIISITDNNILTRAHLGILRLNLFEKELLEYDPSDELRLIANRMSDFRTKRINRKLDERMRSDEHVVDAILNEITKLSVLDVLFDLSALRESKDPNREIPLLGIGFFYLLSGLQAWDEVSA